LRLHQLKESPEIEHPCSKQKLNRIKGVTLPLTATCSSGVIGDPRVKPPTIGLFHSLKKFKFKTGNAVATQIQTCLHQNQT